MATLQKLRNRAGVLLAAIIGLSLLAFILGDFLNSSAGFFQRNRLEIAEIDGKSISYQDFQARVEQSVENYKQNSGVNNLDEGTYASIRNQVWSGYLNELLYEKQYKKMGLACSGDELFDMVQGRNIHPQIQSAPIFQNKVSGQFDRNLVIQFLKGMNQDQTGRQRAAWVSYEKELAKDRVYTKYQTLITKGLYVTRKMVDTEFVETTHKYNFNYVALRYATTPDSIVKITESDIEKYYDEHEDEFKQDPSRDLSYVAFDIVPSQTDKDAVEKWINDQKAEFSRIDNVRQFITLNSDNPFNEAYFGTLDIPDTLRSWAMAAEKGMVYGPYLEGETWKLARITDIQELPDSVKASHILIQPGANQDFTSAQKTADSIKQLIEKGADFGLMAIVHGTDGTKDKGGDLGWFTMTQMDPDFAKACFFAKKGELLTVRTKYGVHIVKVNDQGSKSKKVQVGYLERKITPSSETIQAIYSQASRFASTYGTSQKFEEGIQKENLNKRLATNLKEEDTSIPGLENPREMVRWAYKAKVGDLSEIFEFGNRFVIAKLTEVRDAGIAPLEQVRSQVENSVRNAKKADYLVAEATKVLQTNNTLEGVAIALKSNVQTVSNAYFTSFSITGLGIEPDVTGALATAPLNKPGNPIKGKNGVYIIQVTQTTDSGSDADRQSARERLQQGFTSRASYEVFAALEKNAKVVDKRNKFY